MEVLTENSKCNFLQESLILYSLQHPSIVKYIGINFQSITDQTKLEPTIYMAPELNEDEEWMYRPGFDVYAFGILAFEIVSVKVPYEELEKISTFKLANKIISGYRPWFTEEVPKSMVDLISRCPSFEEIFDQLSTDNSLFSEKVDMKEVNETRSRRKGKRKQKTSTS